VQGQDGVGGVSVLGWVEVCVVERDGGEGVVVDECQ